ncbi:MAG: cytochrome c biogenesis protein ResB, partial [Desulfobacteraceae bacterium]|nr:cytochrome c biogenesis protein ResB [Desulfobacteraceae bacterium]
MTQTKESRTNDNQATKPFFQQTWDFFASVKLAIYVLVLIAATSIIGTIIPQNASNAFYFQKYGTFLYKIFMLFDFNNMYQAWWFLLLLFLLVINLIVCSIDRLNKTWKIIFPKKISFNVNRFRKLKIKNTFVLNADSEKTLSAYKQFLSKQFKKMAEKETENSTAIYVENGR